MTKKQLQALLDKLPDNTEVFVRVNHEDCYPAKASAFTEYSKKTVLYLEAGEAGNHRNYSGLYLDDRGIKQLV